MFMSYSILRLQSYILALYIMPWAGIRSIQHDSIRFVPFEIQFNSIGDGACCRSSAADAPALAALLRGFGA